MILDEILQKGWTVNISYSPVETFCFIFSDTGKEMGFAKGKVKDDKTIELAFQRALDKERRISVLQEKKKVKQPELYEEL